MVRKLVLIGALVLLAYASIATVFQLITVLNQEESDREYANLQQSEREFLSRWEKDHEVAPGIVLSYEKDSQYVELERRLAANRAHRPKSRHAILVLGGVALALVYATVTALFLIFRGAPSDKGT